MAGNINANLANALKILYPSTKLTVDMLSRFPFLAMLKKNTKFSGHYMHVPVTLNHGANASRTASTALALTNVSDVEAFAVTRGHDYAVAYIPREDWLASKDDRGAFLNTAKFQIDGQINALLKRLSRDIFRSGSGSIGQVGSVSGTSLTLASIPDARFFEIGMEIAASSADGTGSLRDSSSTATVTGVNRASGVITTDTGWSTDISGLVADDYLFEAGDHDSPTTGTAGIKGLSAWLSTSASPGALFGVTRTTDKVRLAGVASTISGSSLRSGLVDVAVELDVQTDASPDICIVHPNQFKKLAKELEGARDYREETKIGNFSFKGLNLVTPHGEVKVMGDAACQSNRGYMLTSGTWELASLGPAPHIVDDDGSQFDRASTADAFSVRIQHYSQLVCRDPGQNAVITIS